MNASVTAALFLSDKFGFLWIDPLFGVGISAFLMINAVRIAMSAVGGLMDHELPDEVRTQIAAIASGHPQVKRVHDLRTRSSGLQKFIQMHIILDPGISLMEAHRISDAVEEALSQAFPGADIIIHQDPDGVLELHTPLGGVL